MQPTGKITNPPASTSAAAPRSIGIYIALPPLSFWMPAGIEDTMLRHIIYGALLRRSLLAGQVALLAFDRRQVIGFVPVTTVGLALSTVADELSALDLLTGAHLAWFDWDEGIFRTDRPLPEPMPWQNHIDAYRAWKKERDQGTADGVRECLAKIADLLGKLPKKASNPQ